MFDVVHEFAVLGTTFFMMALATVWYSPMLFGKRWISEARITDTMLASAESQAGKHMVLTFCSYAVMLFMLALVVAYAPRVGLQPLEAAGLIVLFVSAGAIPAALFEGRSIRYFGIQAGFYSIFIVVGVALLEYWPW